ncbi:Uncharacterised protein [uncultured archaeon]|nr:Uncharacterised protein [uncultured archaeon]
MLTTHYMEEAEMLCDRVAIVDLGKVILLGTPSALKKKIGGDMVLLKVSHPNIAAVKKLRYVRKVTFGKDALVLTVDNASAHLQEILKAVGRVDDVELRSPTLNDVFLRYTGKEIRESGEEGGWGERSMHYQNR